MKFSSSLPYLNSGAHLLGCVLLLVCAGCSQTISLRGDRVGEDGKPIPSVVDREGKGLPGVAVTLAGTDVQAVTDGLGQYRIQCPPGEWQVTFEKTGYTPAIIDVDLSTAESVDASTATLWPLPESRGLFAYFDYRYTALERSEAKRFLLKQEGQATPKVVFGLKSIPILILQESRPLIIGYKIPSYDLRLDHLVKATAAILPRAGAALPSAKAYDQEIWIAAERVNLRTLPLDEPERLLYALDLEADLEAGEVYALHWGALNGTRTQEQFIYLFQYLSPEMVAEMDAAEAAALEAAEKEAVTEDANTE